jgi:drug/metabolite transporter (DMT)-like permease
MIQGRGEIRQLTMTRTRADAVLLFVTVIWGIAFVAQRFGSAHMSPLSFNAARFLLGGILVALFAWWRSSGGGGAFSIRCSRDGLALGTALALAALLQQIGVPQTTTANSSFLTIMNVIFVPLMSVLVGYRPRAIELVGACIAVVGAYLMSVDGEFSVHPGDWWVLASALFWAVHIVLISLISSRHDPFKLAAEQFLVCGLLSLAGALIFEDRANQNIIGAMPSILFAGGVSVALAYTLQVVAQRNVTPSHAVIILSLEGVFGALAGWVLCDESMTQRAILGAVILTAGVILAQVPAGGSEGVRT